MFFLGFGLTAQEPFIYHSFDGENLKMRWVINDAEQWAANVEAGFKITKRKLSTGETSRFIVQHKTTEYLDMDPDEAKDQFYLALLLDEERSDMDFFQSAFPNSDFNEQIVKVARRDLTDNIIIKSFDFIKLAGFGFEDEEVDSDQGYEYRIESADESLAGKQRIDINFSFDPSKYSNPELPELEVKWYDRRADVIWNTREHNGDFYGYQLQLSMDGNPFEIVDSLLINPMDTSGNTVFHDLHRAVILDNNDITHTFRLHGINYLGELTENYKVITGSGNTGIGLSPLIESTTQLKTNNVDIQWSILDKFADNVKEWRIYVAEQWEGPYMKDTIGIGSEERNTIRPIPFEDSYFRVVAVDGNGDEFSSFPQLVVNLDTIPPAVPEDIKASIDSNGVVELNWSSNSESDFYGYKVFYGYDTLIDMTLAHEKALATPFFSDTLGLKSTNRWVYYKIISIDRRNNRSDFSELIALKKPDILPPVAPHFHDFRGIPGGSTLAWYPSVSNDVINQKLFRRRIAESDSWELIQEWLVTDIDSIFRDTNLVAFEQYAYLLIAEDGDGNVSEPSQPIVITVLPDHSKIDVEAWTLKRDDNGRIVLTHELDNESIEEIRIYKSINNGNPFELAILPAAQVQFVDQASGNDEVNSYFIRILFLDGTKSPYSQKKTIP